MPNPSSQNLNLLIHVTSSIKCNTVYNRNRYVSSQASCRASCRILLFRNNSVGFILYCQSFIYSQLLIEQMYKCISDQKWQSLYNTHSLQTFIPSFIDTTRVLSSPGRTAKFPFPNRVTFQAQQLF